MKLGGFNPFTLTDYPGKIAAIVYTQGCNFRCRYCHNPNLIPANSSHPGISWEHVIHFFSQRKDLLEAVVVTGGEPTIQPDLISLLKKIRSFGFAIKLDTNGSNPQIIRAVTAAGLADYLAMDVKAPYEKLARLSGVTPEEDCLEESIQIIASSGIKHEFRTTLVEPLLNQTDISRIKASLPEGSPHRVLPFLAQNAWDPTLSHIEAKTAYPTHRIPVSASLSSRP